MRYCGAMATTEYLPAIIPDRNDRAYRLADTFASSARTDHTVAARRRDLLGPSSHPERSSPAWLPWCTARSLDPLGNIRPAHLLAWVAELRDAGDAESSRNRRLSTVSAWYEWLLREDMVPANPASRLKPTEKPKAAGRIYATSPTAAPSRGQLQALQRAADAGSAQDAAIIALLSTTGARVSELVGADVEGIGQDDGQPVLSILGKGGKVRTYPLTAGVYRRVHRMLEERTADAGRLPAVAAGARPRRPLLVQPRLGGRMTRHDVARVLTRVAEDAGLSELRLTPHGLRGGYATLLLRAGVPIYDVQRAMGHVSTDTTRRYDHGHLDLDRHPTHRMAALLAEDDG